MTARLWKLLSDIGEAFWLVPAAIVLMGVLMAIALVDLDRSGVVPDWLIASAWLYNGGGTGARTLLGVVASSTIGVAGTVFSITIAALSLAAGQMGPRLLRNFTSDRANQLVLGIFLGTFSYALMVLRSVRTVQEGEFVPHLALSVSVLLAFLCVGTLVFFVAHMAARINVDTVIDLVSREVRSSVLRLTDRSASPNSPPESFWTGAVLVTDDRRGYLQHLDESGLANWAAERNAAIRLFVRAGDYVFPGAPIAAILPDTEGAAAAIRNATALAPQRITAADLEFAIRQLVEVAVRALSPGINDPHTAIGVLDQLGGTLCELVGLHLPNGVTLRGGRPVLVVPGISYDGLSDAMFHMIRQNAAGSTAVLARMLEVLAAVASCEAAPERVAALQRHAGLVLADAVRSVCNPSDLADIRSRHAVFDAARRARAA